MPELPEVENIKFGLEDRVIDKEIVDITYSNIVKSSHKENKNKWIFKLFLLGKLEILQIDNEENLRKVDF